jgi:hypothetical protein
MGNNAISGNDLVRAGIDRLAARLPPGWTVAESRLPGGRQTAPLADAVLRVRGPGSSSARLLVKAKQQLDPKDVELLAIALPRPDPKLPVVIISPFLSARTQEKLKAKGLSYADLTGNIRLVLSSPGLFVETRGADKNPEPRIRERRSLKGGKAGRIIRALCDFRPPQGLRELARRAGVNPGYASRIMDFLDREALVTRKRRGAITAVDWPALLRRWAQEYSPFQRSRVSWYLAARGLGQVSERLRSVSTRYVVSGSWAASQLAPIAPTRILLCYADDVPELADELGLRPADAGSNVALVRPLDPVVYERTFKRKGVTVAAPSQVAVDLMTSPGRGPNEAEALIEWMVEHENVWRS